MSIRVNVTAEDIAAGKPREGDSCPIALAVERAVPSCWISVEPTQVVFRVYGTDKCAKVAMPPAARLFVSRFDEGEPVEPFAFDLDVPDFDGDRFVVAGEATPDA